MHVYLARSNVKVRGTLVDIKVDPIIGLILQLGNAYKIHSHDHNRQIYQVLFVLSSWWSYFHIPPLSQCTLETHIGSMILAFVSTTLRAPAAIIVGLLAHAFSASLVPRWGLGLANMAGYVGPSS
uniref:Uncharacterized protein n=1 Tax=Eutreptiella gymnastica TaxID=73025 RepID=A0A7S1N3Y2_9EUGL|mmetsp:Transcript_115149/g.200437  ORF Transcript_115149/g.200437 Transcript_115149/m.200437 type:complete len:125 (+) Transcript_115149:1704-2078(+)